MPLRNHAICAVLVLIVAGCGGGGGEERAANVNLTINWAARSRSLDAPSSALSVIVMLKKAATNGGDFVYTINRAAEPAAYTKSYSSPTQARVGTWTLSVRFFSLPDAQGDVVGTIDAVVNIDKHGKGIGNLETVGTIATVSVSGQTIGVGETADLLITAQDKNGAMIALAPGAAFVKVISGSDKVQAIADQVKGIAVGTAMVVATVDKITSQPGTVTVAFLPVVTISPELVGVLINGSLHFSATVTSAPDQGIIWSVQEGATGGTITQDGTYAAPGTSGTYHVVATSHFNTGRSATATVIVNNGNGLGPSGIYVVDSGNNRIVQMRDMTGDSWSAIGTQGNGQYQFFRPNGIHVTPDGKILVADTGNNRIVQMDDITGKNWRAYGSLGSGAGRFNDPHDVTVGPGGKIYIADRVNYRVVRVDDISGTGWTTTPSGLFQYPTSCRVTSDGKIYVAAQNSGSIGVFRFDSISGAGPAAIYETYGYDISGIDADGQSRVFGAKPGFFDRGSYIYNALRQFDFATGTVTGLVGVGQGEYSFRQPQDVCIGPDGKLYVAETAYPAGGRVIRIDDFTGTNWTFFGTTGSGIGQFSNPTGIFVR